MKGCGDKRLGQQVLDSLAQLAKGEGWVWFPEGNLLDRVKFPKILTFDSSKTPEDGEELRSPSARATINLSAITATMAQAVEEAKASDPKALRAEIAELRKKLEAAGNNPSTTDAGRVAQLETERRALQAATNAGEIARMAALNELVGMRDAIDGLSRSHGRALEALKAQPESAAPARTPVTQPQCTNVPYIGTSKKQGAVNRNHTRISPESRTGWSSTQFRILDALAMWKQNGVDLPTTSQVAFVARIKPTGGHFGNTVGPLSTAGLVDRSSEGHMRLTPKGEGLAVCPDAALTLADYHSAMLGLLATGAQKNILRAIIAEGGKPITTKTLGHTTSIDHAGGHFGNSIGPLGTLGLITRRDGVVTPTRLLFPEGLQ